MCVCDYGCGVCWCMCAVKRCACVSRNGVLLEGVWLCCMVAFTGV